MAKVITDHRNYERIAAAIRTRTGGETAFKPAEMADAILALEGASRVEDVHVYDRINTVTIAYEGGLLVTAVATFDTELGTGLPTEITDTLGNTVRFVNGYPVVAVDKAGNEVPITWGGT